MRKHQHRQILDIIATLKEANSEIRRLFQQGELSAVLRLLGDCQEGAVQIGEFIELLEGEGTKTVALLEEYHESLYRAGEEIETADASFMKSLQKQLFLIENSVRSELAPDRIEVAFFPYKASMWDSLESIWLAAKEDPGCDAYVVPIPYFDRLPDGGLGQRHYEGGLYPDDVPVVDWRAYQLEERRPDVIFIHNPYDDRNAVTSVPPDYYSDRLKAFTDLVCYVPYFVTPGDVEEHFVLCPGVLNADRVFLQSEKIRETYIRVFKEFEKKNRCVGQFGKAEKKFVASGSPKFDRVLNTKREDYDLPEEWKTLIDNKKVVFYNTSIGALLEGDEQYLKKLRSVLDIFHRRSDMMLWWRPHPLSEATYRSMRPHLLAEYEQIVAEYRREGWGIYDDTPDFHRAICMSDAYLGDWSSLVALYEVTDKPILIQDAKTDLTENNEYRQFLFGTDGESNELFCVTTYHNLISSISLVDIDSLTRQYYCDYPVYESELITLPFSYALTKVGRKSYFAPRWWVNGNHLAVYDENTRRFEYIVLQKKIDQLLDDKENNSIKNWSGSFVYSNSPKFQNVIHYKDSLFITPSSYPAIVKLNMNTGEVSYYSDFIKGVLSISGQCGARASYAFSASVQTGAKVYITCRWADLLVEFDMESCESKVIKLSERGFGNQHIQFDGSNIWLFAAANSNITRWNPVTMERKVFHDYPKELAEMPLWQSFAVFEGVLVASIANGEQLPLKINIDSGEISVATELMKLLSNGEHVTSVFSGNKKLYFLTDKARFFELDGWNKSSRIGDVSISEEENQQFGKRLAEYHGSVGFRILTENAGLSLDDFLNAAGSGIKSKDAGESPYASAGERIYEYAKFQVL